jgi:hypothetical protein
MSPDTPRAGPRHEEPARHVQLPAKATESHPALTVADAPDDTVIHRAAVQAVERGWFVFPTRPGGKEPRRGLSWPEAAVGELAQLSRARWRPGENYGIAAKRSGLVIIDLDQPKPDYELPPAWRDEPGVVDGRDVFVTLMLRAGVPSWPHTFTVTTPSGGRHLYYTAPPGRPIGNKPLGPLIDVRGGGDGNGGYVLGPGSILNGRKYEIADDMDPRLLPDWIADLLDPPQEGAGSAKTVSPNPAGGDIYWRLRGLVQYVIDRTPGDRNGPLYWAACRAAEMVRAGEIDTTTAERVLTEAALASGLRGGEAEARRTIASGLKRGTTT